jgi:hypothetical protein
VLPELAMFQGQGFQKEASTWPLDAKFVMSQRRILGHVLVETKKLTSKDRNIVYNTDIGGAYLITGAMSALPSRVFIVGGFTLISSEMSIPPSFWILGILVVTLPYQLDPKTFKIFLFTKCWYIMTYGYLGIINKGWVLPGAPFNTSVHLSVSTFFCERVLCPEESFSQGKCLSLRDPCSFPEHNNHLGKRARSEGESCFFFSFLSLLFLMLQLIEGVEGLKQRKQCLCAAIY